MRIELFRETLKPATVGRLSIEGAPECDTLEREWADNLKGRSCIPSGVYPVTLGYSPRFGRDMLRLSHTGHRVGILIHAANHVHELSGCIALGKRLGPDSLMESKAAVTAVENKVRAALARGEAVTLEIRNPEVSA